MPVRRALVAVVLVTAGCGQAGAGPHDQATLDALPPPPPVVEPSNPVPTGIDGLTRVVVTVPDGVAGLSAPIGTGTGTWPGSPPRPSALAIDDDQLEQIPQGAMLAVEAGEPGYRDQDGRFVAFSSSPPPSSPPAPQAAHAPITTDASPPDDSGPPSARDLLSRLDGVVSVDPIGGNAYAVTTADPGAIADAGVAVEPDPLLSFASDPYEGYQWAIDNNGHNLDNVQNQPPPQSADADVDGLEAAAGPRGQGVVVAVIDSGVDFSHPDLATAAWANPGEVCGNGVDDDVNGFVDDCRGWDFGHDDAQPYSSANSDHGTHVAGIIAASATNGLGVVGLAPGAAIMDLSVAGPGGMTTSSVARAIRYAVDNGADVINMSLGTSPGTSQASVQPLIDATLYAEQHDVLVVVAAGNNGVDLGTTTVYPASIDASNVLAVGASSPDDARASFSNYGGPVDVFAPGVLLLSTLPGRTYGFMSGTSQASPATAAVAATVLESQPDLTPAEVVRQITGTADELPALTPYVANGVRVNQARALGINPDAASSSPSVTVSSLSTAGGSVQTRLTLHPGTSFDQPYQWQASLVGLRSGSVYGLVGLPITVDGDALTTDSRGAIALAPAGEATVDLATSLPAGTYGLVVEAVPTADPSMHLGQAFAVTFNVAGLPSPATTTPPTTPPSTGTGPTSVGPTTTAGPTTTVPSQQPTTSSRSGSGAVATTAPNTTTGATNSGSTATTATGRSGGSTSATTSTGGSTSGGSTTGATSAGPTPSTTGPGGATTTAHPTPTTAAPTTRSTSAGTSPGGSANTSGTTTTAPPTTVQPGWAVATFGPTSGPVGSATVVSITGTFPESVHVWFGNQQGQVIYQSNTWIVVATPTAAAPGPVDVTLRTSSKGTVLTMPAAFSFTQVTSSGSSSGSSSPTTTTRSGGSSSGPTSTTARSGGSSGTPTTSPGASPSTTPTPPTAAPSTITSPTTIAPSSTSGPTVPVANSISPRSSVLGDPIDLGNGIQGVALNGWSSLGGVPTCASDPCRTRLL